MRRLPFEPLLVRSGFDQATVRFASHPDRPIDTEVAAPISEFARFTGRSARTVHRWSVQGIPLRSAEDICDLLTLHPCEVWGDTWIDLVLEGEPETVRENKRQADFLRTRASWSELEAGWRSWRLERDRIELHREPWVVA